MRGLGALALGLLAACQGALEPTPPPTGELIVRFEAGVDAARRDEILRAVGGRVLEVLPVVEGLYRVVVTRPLAEARRTLEAFPEVRYAEPNELFFPAAQSRAARKAGSRPRISSA